MVLGALGALAGGVIDAIGADKASRRARRANQGNLQTIRDLMGLARGANETGFANARPFMDMLLSTLQEGARRSEGAQARAGREALRFQRDIYDQAVGEGNAQLARRGLGNTTLASNVGLAAADMAGRAATRTAMQSGSLLSGLIAGNARATSAGYGSLADFERARGATKAGLLAQEAGILSGVQHTAQPQTGYGSLLGAAGGILGGIDFGGLFGGGGGKPPAGTPGGGLQLPSSRR